MLQQTKRLARQFIASLSKLPLCLWITVASLGLIAAPALELKLEYDRDHVEHGEIWRLVSSHFVHWDLEHFFWDAATFLALGWMLERKSRGRFIACLTCSAMGITVGIWRFAPDLIRYRGLSGIDTAIFVAFVMMLLQDKLRAAEWGWVTGISALLCGLIGKTVFEFWTGQAMFVQSAGSTFEPTPLAHVIGATIGLAVAIWPERDCCHERANRRSALTSRAFVCSTSKTVVAQETPISVSSDKPTDLLPLGHSSLSASAQASKTSE